MSGWTTPNDVVATLRARWLRGVFLRRYAAGEPWEPVRLPLRGPGADDVMRDQAAVRHWASLFDDVKPFVVESRTVRSKTLGKNDLPARVHLEIFGDLVGVLGVEDEVAALDRALAAARSRVPALVPWVVAHPMQVVAAAAVWDRLLDVVQWIEANDGPRFVRHVDIPGIDTKFIESNEKLLRQLLPLLLAPERVMASERSFARRFGFLDKPAFTRLRFLSGSDCFPAGISEVQLRTEELASVELAAATMFVVENEVAYLSFPDVDDAIAINGCGFAVTTLEQLPWLAHRRLVYWGDLDTHGFAILDRLRQRFPHVESMLMDLDTLLSHEGHWSSEDAPASGELANLTPTERALYAALVEDRFGRAVRLEQERVRFSAVRRAVDQLTI